MKWFARLFCLVAAVGGFAAAHLLAQDGRAAIPPVPTVSVTAPTLPVPTATTPTLPVPSVPAPTVPVPVPSTPTPTVTVPPPATTTPPPVQLPPALPRPPATTSPAPTPRAAQPTTSTAATAPSQPASRGTSPSASPSRSYAPSSPSRSSGAQSSSSTPSSTARPQAKTFEARVQRSRNRVSVRLAFVLPKADRLFVIVRGPAPSCRIAGYIPVRGHKGANTVFFAGRVHGRRLGPGVYLLSLSTNRRLDPSAATEYVRVRSPRRSVPLPEQAQKPSCSDVAGASTSDAIERAVLAGAVAKTSKSRPTASLAGTAAGSPSGEGRDGGASGVPQSDVLGATTDVADEQPFVAIAVLTIVGALLLTMLVLVTRFLRGSWNP
jgi:hypothetical protein